MTAERNYAFSWDLIGDPELGRPNLGNKTRIEAYRLLQFSLRDVVEQALGTERTDQIFFEAGALAGKNFYENMLKPTDDLNSFIKELQLALKDLGIGILRVEKADMEKGEMVITVSEDLECSGLPESGSEICVYDEGFLSALLECYTGIPFRVKEVDCWCTGDRTCRFQANAIKFEK